MPRMTRTIISLSEEEKQWLVSYSRTNRVSSAEVIRRAIRDLRLKTLPRSLKTVLKETAGAWTSIKGDSRAYVEALRKEWERPS